jgi:glycosyltransferase involved in cell wall biosynthesis
MRIGLIAPPFIEVPPRAYGGTELFIANLARELHGRGHDVTVYANGSSQLPCQVKWRYRDSDWPLKDPVGGQLKNADHAAWAMHDATSAGLDIVHLNDAMSVPYTLFSDRPAVLTIHHPHEPSLSELYRKYPRIHYVAIADWLAARESLPRVHVVPHGIPADDYVFSERKDDYVAFLGRMAPCKAPHLAIEAARRAGVRLKLAGEIQPVFLDYWQSEVRPRIDGRQIEYVGEADHAVKNELLSHARCLLFPIQWEEPFGLVMIEAMACGTPVLAFLGGAVAEVVRDGVNGWVCRDIEDMARRIVSLEVRAATCREYVQARYSAQTMATRYLSVYERALRAADDGLEDPAEDSDDDAGPALSAGGKSPRTGLDSIQ